MARETIGYTRLEWVCPNCKGKNPGSEKVCTTCGAPQPENVAFQNPDKDELIQDEKEIEKAKTGPDIHCPYCGTRNPAGATTCKQCSGDLKGAMQRASGNNLGGLNQQTVKQVKCPSCGSNNPENTLRCAQCGAPLTPSASSSGQDKGNKKIPVWGYILMGFFILTMISCGVWFINKITQRSDVTGVVQSVSWQRSIEIEKYGPVNKDDWKDSIPAGANIGSCNWKVHHTQDEPAENAEKVCSEPQKIDKGNGYSEVVQECQYEVKEEYCEYTIDEWHKSNEVNASGTNLNPYWPDLNIVDNQQREGRRSESYSVYLTGEGKNYQYHPDSTAFSQFSTGSSWIIVVDGFDNIISIRAR